MNAQTHSIDTRSRIIAAATDLYGQGDEAPTNAQIAGLAGVTERTLYRHFPTRPELDAAVWTEMTRRMGGREGFPQTPQEMIHAPKVMFEGFDDQEALSRWFVRSPHGQAIRLSVKDQRQAAYRKIVAEARPDLQEPALTHVAAICQLLDSSFAWQSIRDYWDMTGAEAGDAVATVLSQLLTPPRDSG